MSFKKIEITGLHPANPLVQIIDSINEHVDDLSTAFDGLAVGQGVVGPTGPKGDAGSDGREGPPGRDGKDGEQGAVGPQGDRGEQGPAGQDGKNGIDGKAGQDGLPGRDGVDGKDGLPGAMGPQGPAGVQGPQGEQGLKGDTGATGPQGLQGIQGVKGDTGEQGIQGPVGATGATGPTGAQGAAGVGIKGFASGYVNAGTFVTLDNLKCTVTTGGGRGLSVASVTGTFQAHISGTFGYISGVGGSATSAPVTYTTTPSGNFFGWSFPNQGDGSVYLINDVTNWRFYRVTLMIGPGYNNNFISIERLI